MLNKLKNIAHESALIFQHRQLRGKIQWYFVKLWFGLSAGTYFLYIRPNSKAPVLEHKHAVVHDALAKKGLDHWH